MPVALEYRSDHLVARMVGPRLLTSLRRSIVVPYSAIRRVDVESPRWPHPLDGWWLGAYVPKMFATAAYTRWRGGERRFVCFGRRADRVLTLHLRDHATFDEVSLEVADPFSAQKELASRAAQRKLAG